ncbi:MAG: N-acetylmuramoyl-L-alanine amidase [Acidobacteriota bacterium]
MSVLKKHSVDNSKRGTSSHINYYLRVLMIMICLASLIGLAMFTQITPPAATQEIKSSSKPVIDQDNGNNKYDDIEDGRVMVHPLEQVFIEAAKEFRVPVEILKAVGYEASRWHQAELDESKNETIGVMGLKARFPGDTLDRAAALLNRDPQTLRLDAVDNIRGAAALLHEIAKELSASGHKLKGDLSNWVEVLARYSGIEDKRLQFEYVSQVYYFINFGVDELVKEGQIFIPGIPIDFGEQGLASRLGLEQEIAPMSTDYGPAIWSASPNYSAGRTRAVDTIVIHDTEGSYSGTISWFKNTASKVSAHYVVRSSDGQITQMVRNADTAWHAACYNSRSIGIEHEGYAATGYQWYTNAMYNTSAALTRYLCNLYGVPKQHTTAGPGIVGHVDVSNSSDCTDHTDPGPYWDWNKYIGLVRGTEIVVDNSSSYFSASSNWWTSVNVDGYYGSNYQVRNTEGISDTATFNLPSHPAGNYAIYARWTAATDRATSAPYIINHNGTTSTVYMNQQGNGGSWNYLGTFYFNGGSSENVKLSCWTSPGYYVIADAVRLVRQ